MRTKLKIALPTEKSGFKTLVMVESIGDSFTVQRN